MDFAILELDEELTWTDKIRPVCIPENNSNDYVGVDGKGVKSYIRYNIFHAVLYITHFYSNCIWLGYYLLWRNFPQHTARGHGPSLGQQQMWKISQQGYHSQYDVCQCTRQGLLPRRLWRPTCDRFGRNIQNITTENSCYLIGCLLSPFQAVPLVFLQAVLMT